MKTIVIGGRAFSCSLSDKFRRHSDDEREAMRESIASGGIRVPVRLYHDSTLDLADCVLDGEGRLEIASSLFADLSAIPCIDAGTLTTDEAYDLARVFNDHRRQDSPEDVRRRRAERIGRVGAKRAEQKTYRQIAAEEGISEEQARRDASISVPTRVGTEDGKVVGKDGKKYKASRAKKKKQATPEVAEAVKDGTISARDGSAVAELPAEKQQEAVSKVRQKKAKTASEAAGVQKPKPAAPEPAITLPEADDEQPESLAAPGLDSLGLPLSPEKAKLWEVQPMARELKQLLSKAGKLVNKIASHQGGYWYRGDLKRIVKAKNGVDVVSYVSPDIEAAITSINNRMPWVSRCPGCEFRHPGKTDPNCRDCRGLDFGPKSLYLRAGQAEQDCVNLLIPKPQDN